MTSFFSKILIIVLTFLSLQKVDAAPWVGAGKLGYGVATFGDGETIPQRSLNAIPISFFGGLRWRKLQFGLNVDYVHQAQSAEPATVDDQNASGSLIAVGPEVQWVGQKWGVSLGYKALSSYTFAQSASDGESVRYAGSGYSITIMRSIRKRLGIYVDGGVDTFNKSNNQVLEPNVRNVRYSLGLIYSNFWK
ncbi:hypothetical protein [Bdellovibrio sp. HCB337]|uniref:hypothetical protein n=1 Tax=Bdellovibrio sp. HCB337 TaxID=3394358 RepID=UPI0039A7605E